GLVMTGAEEEWSRSLEASKRGSGVWRVSVYFYVSPPPGSEAQGVHAFRDAVYAERRALAQEFNSADEFERIFRGHLILTVTDLPEERPSLGLPPVAERLARWLSNCSTTALGWPPLSVDEIATELSITLAELDMAV